MTSDLYKKLGVDPAASAEEIKSAYRELVKKHHPDAGGDQEIILSINAAWEVLGDPDKRKNYDSEKRQEKYLSNEAKNRGARNARASAAASAINIKTAAEETNLLNWIEKVYIPIDRLIGKIINPFPEQLRKLSADPYDDHLMEGFCEYLTNSKKHLEKIDLLYRSNRTPDAVKDFGLSLYHCLSQVEDALNEFERYTMGYVDNYLHDGREMLKEAKKKRISLKQEHRRFGI